MLSLIGVVATNSAGSRNLTAALEKAQAVTDTKIDELTREVREHNGFARKIPVLEAEIKNLSRRIEELEKEAYR